MSNIATKIAKIFGLNAINIDDYPPTSPDSTGFSAEGGYPENYITTDFPTIQQFNRLFFELFSVGYAHYQNFVYKWSATHSSNLGGYKSTSDASAVVLGDDGQTLYVNTVNNNTTNPNSGGAGWKAIASSVGYASSVASNGYIKFPTFLGGLIVQWGSSTFAIAAGEGAGGNYNQTLPLEFPNNFFIANATYKKTGIVSGSVGCYCSIVDNNTLNLTVDPSLVAETSPATVYWLAIGN